MELSIKRMRHAVSSLLVATEVNEDGVTRWRLFIVYIGTSTSKSECKFLPYLKGLIMQFFLKQEKYLYSLLLGEVSFRSIMSFTDINRMIIYVSEYGETTEPDCHR